MDRTNTIFLFDVDGTLSLARKTATPEMKALLKEIRSKVSLGMVGGSDVSKQIEQLGESLFDDFDYVFSQNGTVSWKDGKQFHEMSIAKHLGEAKLKEFINFCLHYIADIDIPIKRGTFIEFRQGMLNLSPIGRNCSYEERLAFQEYDNEHKIRAKFVEALQARFAGWNLRFSIGGQISLDVFPEGWDKTYCLSLLPPGQFTTIHFFGDKTKPGENDYEIFSDARTIGHSVLNPDDTMRQIKEALGMS